MYTKLAILLVVLFSVSEQNTMFRHSSNFVKNKKISFVQSFLQLSNRTPVVENIQIVSLTPLEKSIEEEMYKLHQEKGAYIKMVVSRLVYNQQRLMIENIKKRGGVVACLPSCYNSLDLDVSLSEKEKALIFKFFHNLKVDDSEMQLALFVRECLKTDILTSRYNPNLGENEVEKYISISHNKSVFDLEDAITDFLRKYHK